MQDIHFKIEIITTVEDLLEKDDYMITFDLKDAHNHIPIHKSFQPLLGMQFGLDSQHREITTRPLKNLKFRRNYNSIYKTKSQLNSVIGILLATRLQFLLASLFLEKLYQIKNRCVKIGNEVVWFIWNNPS
jgi:hypothetical protein